MYKFGVLRRPYASSYDHKYGRVIKTSFIGSRLRILSDFWYPCPGFGGDPSNYKGKFGKWDTRSKTAIVAYWRRNPEDYKKIRHKN
jgi:hypothetical protein